MKYLEIFENNLSPYFCKHIIKKFERDSRSVPGLTAMGLNLDVKDSQDLLISDIPDWEKEDRTFFEKLSPVLDDYYMRHFIDPVPTLSRSDWKERSNIIDKGYQIQRTTSDQKGFVYHHDGTAEDSMRRIITYLWYLNDIPEDEGGSTEFYDGVKIQPKTGRLILFPATWTFMHRGNPPKKGNKYICTGWVYSGLQ